MAKRKKRKQSSKCPEPLNTMIDIAGGLAMNAIANHMEKKYHYRAKGKINPYKVSAHGIASGRMQTTEDVLRTGAILGALGSFDVDADIPDDPIFYDIAEPKVNDNRYAWRLNCEDGSEYGIYPEDYETRDEYHEALAHEKYAWREWCEDGSEYGLDPEDFETEDDYNEALEEAEQQSGNDLPHLNITVSWEPESSEKGSVDDPPSSFDTQSDMEPEKETADPVDKYDDLHVFIYCKVELLDSGDVQYFRTEDKTIRKGDTVIIPLPDGNSGEGRVLSVEHHMSFSAPVPVEETPVIIRKM